ncbi:MAG: triose-phosphate isomerase [Candidatus Doudnabacteria bacterium RIFCSPHIGHO2_01_FULL_50_11]|uniref:Triosephosphate isomerase n=1 Tax=Candidatus Doudnabacteria bacterium RIFCSPHIGHO2_01_FULL_50_11 TaxID=1817828 RepID=A0A1F5PMP6_9BACT|nr:MAG: triose-phosphate isomerase [Candidatus Doudnabacteria bacterium RIFCSPHIGHO2_01_FULL_50_11]HLC44672.1 triose-phosphate isomerase [Patescibacteria group bacterium]
MKKYIIGNWKMNPSTFAEADRLASRIQMLNRGSAEVVLCPPVYFLAQLSKKFPQLFWGAQDCFWEASGAYTGEISSEYIRTHGAAFVLLGHSERRMYLEESDEMVAKKLRHVLKRKLTPVLCVGGGEGLREPEQCLAAARIQLTTAVRGIPGKILAGGRIIIAYEPTWAIGTGRPATSKHIAAAASLIREQISSHYGTIIADGTPVLYGGSVNASIVPKLKKKSNLQGYLVGGASLNALEFSKIIELS